jgi:hypothetical protein
VDMNAATLVVVQVAGRIVTRAAGDRAVACG